MLDYMDAGILILILSVLLLFLLLYCILSGIEIKSLKRENESLKEAEKRAEEAHQKEKQLLYADCERKIKEVIRNVYGHVYEATLYELVKELDYQRETIDQEIQNGDLSAHRIVSSYIIDMKRRFIEMKIEITVLREENRALKKKIEKISRTKNENRQNKD